MCSKALTSLFLLTVLFELSCTLGERPPPSPVIAINGQEFSCLKAMGEEIHDYLEAKKTEKEVRQFSTCVSGAFRKFETYSKGQNPEVYRPDEIRAFLKEYFVRETPISDELLRQAMEVKVSLVGGSKTIVTRAEIRYLIGLLEELGNYAVELLPYIPTLNYRLGITSGLGGRSEAALAEASQALDEFAQKFGQTLGASKSSYSFKSLEALLTEVRSFMKWETHFEKSHPVEDWVEMLKSFKSLAVAPQDEGIRPGEWATLLKALVDWYSAWLNYQYIANSKQSVWGSGFGQLKSTTDLGLSLLDKAVKAQPDQVISYPQINRFVDAIGKLGWLPQGIRAASVKQALPPLFEKMLRIPKKPKTSSQTGLSLVVVSQARTEFYEWAGIQDFLNRRVQAESQVRPEAENPYSTLSLHDSLFGKDFTSGNGLKSEESVTQEAHLEELHRLLSRVPPLFRDQDTRTFIGPMNMRRAKVIRGHYNASMMNLIRGGVRLILRGYSSDESGSGVNERELQSFTEDIKLLAEDLNLISPNNVVAGRNIFWIGNLFTYTGDGVNPPVANPKTEVESERDKLNFDEGLEALAMIISVKTITDRFYGFFSKECQMGPADFSGRLSVQYDCFFSYLRGRLLHELENMPEMVKLLSKVGKYDWFEMESLIWQAVNSPEQDSNWITHSQMSQIILMFHAVEGLITRFDLNLDGSMDLEESKKASPIFEGIIAQVLTEKGVVGVGTEELESIFLYILQYQELPGIPYYHLYPPRTLWNWARAKVFGSSVSLDRMGAVRIFSSLIRPEPKVK